MHLFGLCSVAVYGGVNKDGQRNALKEAGAAMVVGTPGWVVDLMEEGVCGLAEDGANFHVYV